MQAQLVGKTRTAAASNQEKSTKMRNNFGVDFIELLHLATNLQKPIFFFQPFTEWDIESISRPSSLFASILHLFSNHSLFLTS
jgi:hypothetical protein